MRYLRFQAWLGEMLATLGRPPVVHFEDLRSKVSARKQQSCFSDRRHAGTDAALAETPAAFPGAHGPTDLYGGLLATLTAWCEREGIAYQGVPVGTIKRHATGHGNAPKAAMIAAMQARGHAPADDNEADALALLHWAMDTQGGAR